MTDPASRGLLVDYGGVLTPSIGASFREFERAEGLPKGTIFRLVRAAYADGADDGAIARIERGEADLATFEELLAAELRDAGHDVAAPGLVARLFAGMRPAGGMWAVVEQAHAAGVRTALVSNSWGVTGYPTDRLASVFDVVVLSGSVGLRKPDAAIFLHAADELGLPPERCAFVDDLDRNVEAAERLGMFGVIHRGPAETAAALAPFLGVELAVSR